MLLAYFDQQPDWAGDEEEVDDEEDEGMEEGGCKARTFNLFLGPLPQAWWGWRSGRRRAESSKLKGR
jgi:hypothetical protein